MTLIIRKYNEGDEKGIVELLGLCFGKLDPLKCLMESWEWRYRQNPEGPGIEIVAEDNGRIVGHYGIIPSRFHLEGKDILLGHASDLAVHPQYRRRGLFLALFKEVDAFLREDTAFVGIVGFPNRITYRAYFQKLGWRPLGSIPLFFSARFPFLFKVLRVTRDRAIRTQDKGILPSRISFRDFHLELLEGLQGLQGQENTSFKGFMRARTKEYLQWRYMGLPDLGYTVYGVWKGGCIQGMVVLRPFEYRGVVVVALMDVVPFPIIDTDTSRELIERLIIQAHRKGADIFVAGLWAKGLDLALPKGLFHLPDFLNPRPWVVGYKAIKEDFLATDLFFTLGDGDII